jgi:hypothetical protein
VIRVHRIATLGAALALMALAPSVGFAAGAIDGSSAPPTALPEASSGWHMQRTPNGGPQNNQLTSVSCTADDACMAVGLFSSQDASRTYTLAEVWNGTRWRIVPTPNRAGVGFNALYGVVCATSTSCIAVGQTGARPLAMSWDGSTWTLLDVPAAKGRGGSDFRGLACASAVSCVAIGGFGGTRHAFSETWDGAAWRIQPVPEPEGARTSYLIGAACSSPTACTAVGNYQRVAGETLTLAERWNGTTWVPQPTPNRGNEGSFLYGVSCPQTSECVAVGMHGGHRHAQGVLVEAWHGSSWSIQRTGAAPPGTLWDELTAVSCLTSAMCTAVGNRATSRGTHMALGANWDGVKWRLSTLPPKLGRFLFAFMQSISCIDATTCTAVGSRGARTLAIHRG